MAILDLINQFDGWKNIQAIVNIIGVIVAAIVYIFSRKYFPKVIQKHEILHERLDEKTLLIRLQLEVKNPGVFSLSPDECDAYLRLITPLLDQTSKRIQESFYGDDSEIHWLSLITKKNDLKKINKIIKSEETDYIYFDFILQDDERFEYSKVSMVLITTELSIKKFWKKFWLVNKITEICHAIEQFLKPTVKIKYLNFKWKWYLTVQKNLPSDTFKTGWWSIYFYYVILETPIKIIKEDNIYRVSTPYKIQSNRG